ncbi:hypothetical protein BH09SUM1_BH09SUM1_25920 [soil metagenome]
MRGVRMLAGFVGALALFPVGCARSGPKNDGVKDVQTEVMRRIDGDLQKGDVASVDPLLTPASAAQLALGNNPRVKAALEDIGIARADVLDAVTLDNPRLGGAVQWPTQGHGYTLDLEIGQNIQKLLLMGSRKKFAGVQLEESQLRTTHEILSVASEAEAGYFEAVGARHGAGIDRMIVEAAEASYEFASRQHEAGNLGELELEGERAVLEEAKVRSGDSELEAAAARERLWRTLGLQDANGAKFQLPDELPPLPEQEPDLDGVEQFSVENSLDLAVHRKQVEVMEQALGITRDWRWLGEVEIGALAQRERDQTWLIGPTLNVEVPIFGRSKAAIQRETAMLRQRELALIDATIAVRSDVRMYRQKLFADRQKATRYLDVIIPNRERIVTLSQQQYNYMLIGVYDVLAAKREEYQAYREYIDSLRDYWITRAALREAAGGKLPPSKQGEPK